MFTIQDKYDNQITRLADSEAVYNWLSENFTDLEHQEAINEILIHAEHLEAGELYMGWDYPGDPEAELGISFGRTIDFYPAG